MTPAQEVALEPALAQMFAQDLEDPTVVGDVVVVGYRRADKAAILDLEDGAEPVGVDLVRAEEPEVPLPGVSSEGASSLAGASNSDRWHHITSR